MKEFNIKIGHFLTLIGIDPPRTVSSSELTLQIEEQV